jgi:hypothetical protein
MPDIDVIFDARKIGGSANPITVSPTVLHVEPGDRARIRFNLRTVSAKAQAGFDFTPAVFTPDSPIHLEGPVPMGATSFAVIDENENRGSLPRRLYCTLWVRYDGQSYPALYPTIINEPVRSHAELPETQEPVLVEAAA